MPRSLLVDAVGSRVAIDLTGLDEGAAAAVRAAWVDATIDDGDAPLGVTTTVVPILGDNVHMLSSLSQQVTLAGIEAARGRAWMLHAAGVATSDGQVVVLVGPSGRGKTTAARALGAVYGYISDETIAIDADGRVWPYRKPLSIIERESEPKTQSAPSALGLQPLPDAELRVAAIALLDRDAAHIGSPVVEVTDIGDALGALVAQTSFLHDQNAALRFIDALATATGGIRTVRYAEAATLPAIIPELARAAAPIVVPDKPAYVAATDRESGSGGPRYSRAEVADEIAIDDPDRIALLTIRPDREGHVTVISGIAPAVWRAADGATLRQLTNAAVDAYGRPEGSNEVASTLVAVGQLLDAGLLTSDEPLFSRRRVDPAVSALAPPPQSAASADSAAKIWRWLEEPVTLTQLSARVAAEAGMDLAAADHVEKFVAELREARLVLETD